MVIRQATLEDIDTLAAIERSAAQLFRDTIMESAMDDPPLDRGILKAALSENALWIADHEGAQAGFLCGTPMGAMLYIDELAVGSEYQGHGLGRALMETCIAEARGRFKCIALTTDRELPWNAPFYAQLGFEEWKKPSAAIAAKLAGEIAHGLDAERRCAMLLSFD